MRIRKSTKKDFKEISKIIMEEYLKHYDEKWTLKNAIKTLNYYQINFIWLITSKRANAFKFYKKIGYQYKEKTTYFSKEIK
jgi:hypothetical protein